jgi:hypothetical protein
LSELPRKATSTELIAKKMQKETAGKAKFNKVIPNSWALTSGFSQELDIIETLNIH